ncbi:MAG: hypothetical protein K2W82_01045 [Candidatus Obscuribacterales bacterium]|nr:hypothetical protein [Candidatus Obscuribacterales bacterium]
MSGKRRHPGMFKPGQSGNPLGRPKESYRISELAKEYTEEALTTLIEIARDKKAPASARVHAASALLDRGWGKPAIHIESVNMALTYEDFLAQLPPPTEEELAGADFELIPVNNES